MKFKMMKVDVDKIQTIDDVKAVLKYMPLTLRLPEDECMSKHIAIAHLLTQVEQNNCSTCKDKDICTNKK